MKVSDIDIKKLKLVGDYVIFEALYEETVGSVQKLVDDDTKPEFGKVIAVGNGKLLDSGERHNMTVKKGDIILFQRYVTDSIRHKGQDYHLIHEEDIIGIVNK